MRHLIPVDPSDTPVIHVGYLEHRVHPWIPGTSLTEHHLTHPPLIVELLCDLLGLDDHPVARFDAKEHWWLGPLQWADRPRKMINAH